MAVLVVLEILYSLVGQSLLMWLFSAIEAGFDICHFSFLFGVFFFLVFNGLLFPFISFFMHLYWTNLSVRESFSLHTATVSLIGSSWIPAIIYWIVARVSTRACVTSYILYTIYDWNDLSGFFSVIETSSKSCSCHITVSSNFFISAFFSFLHVLVHFSKLANIFAEPRSRHLAYATSYICRITYISANFSKSNHLIIFALSSPLNVSSDSSMSFNENTHLYFFWLLVFRTAHFPWFRRPRWTHQYYSLYHFHGRQQDRHRCTVFTL